MAAERPESVVRDELDLTEDVQTRHIDVRELGPPGPLTETLETLEDMGGDAVLVQVNDRAPKFLYPKLEDRGYDYETIDTEDAVVTAIWEA
ncbi:MAG: hypothetical protein ACI8XM_002540 [Haloarculaceae archaeon]|jgi:hypothetical protein